MVTDLEKEFLFAARTGDSALGSECISKGVDINVRDPEYGASAMHFAAAASARPFLARLIRHPDVDFLAKDSDGLTVCDIAHVHANDPRTGATLTRLAARQEYKPVR